jgi:hypothetical protein
LTVNGIPDTILVLRIEQKVTMRVETKVKIIICSACTIAVVLSVSILVLICNEAFGTTTTVGEPYDSTYSYCAVTSYGAKGQSWCSQYKTGHERRIRTHINGVWWDGESSKLVQ